MRCVSIWQPWASLVVQGHKLLETRSYAAPRSLIGQTIGIASTKNITREQRIAMAEPEFAKHYARLDLPPIEELYCGYLLGTATLHSCEPITQELVDDITDEELAFGWYSEGRWIWRLRYARAFKYPIPVRGAQGIWNWKGDEQFQSAVRSEKGSNGEAQERPADIRHLLRVA